MKISKIRYIYFTLGLIFLILGILGILLPLLPTTPFLLLATYFFSKSSERLYQWLIHQKHFGPMIKKWHDHRIIPRKAKISASVMILAINIFNFIYLDIVLWAKFSALLLCILGLIYIWSQKES